MERILNKRTVREKKRFLVWWKRYTVKEDTWKSRENLKNIKELVEEFERKYREKAEEIRWQKEEDDKREFLKKLLERFIAKVL